MRLFSTASIAPLSPPADPITAALREFWGLYNHIVPPSFISANSNFYLFKEGIRPAWEDTANAQGGKWAVQLPREKSREHVDRWWLYTVRHFWD